MEDHQLEFDAIVSHLPHGAAARRARPQAGHSFIIDTITLNRILFSLHVPFATYVVMLAVRTLRETSPPVSVSQIARTIGYGLSGVRNQVKRTPWFDYSTDLRCLVTLSPMGETKLAAIQEKIRRHIAHARR